MALEAATLIQPALAANIWTILASAVVSLGSALIVIKTAQIKTAPAGEEALTNRLRAIDDRAEAERERLESRIEDLESQVGRLEILLLREREWADAVEIAAAREGLSLPKRPQLSHRT